MPIFEYRCIDCGTYSEVLVMVSGDKPRCSGCGGNRLKKMLSAHAPVPGAASRFPGPGDTACCGSSPTHTGCEGPGSCCGNRLE